jgi:very-short-patch-repair endonuclease
VGVNVRKNLTDIARKLRKHSTEAEKWLWLKLSKRQLEGHKFRRQQPIGKYVVDFVNYEKKIIIELDGGQPPSLNPSHQGREEFLTDV